MCAALALVVAATPARADAIDEARALRRQGIGWTIGGAGLDLAGAGLLMGAFFTPSCAFAIAIEPGHCGYSASRDSEVRGLFLGGVVVSVFGDAVLVVGAAQWGIGARRIKKLQRATAAR
ncbi:MAG: hypothetical protein JWM53_2262 [bacterium]|nr:hypothetical protein [bacterium]